MRLAAQNATRIDASQPHVFLSFERKGEGKFAYETESRNLIWLRFNNNSKWAVRICVQSLLPLAQNFQTPSGLTEVALSNGIEASLCYGGQTHISRKITVTTTTGKTAKKRPKIKEVKETCPLNYYEGADFGKNAWVRSGTSVVFSVPADA
jgi:hypothetical protein